MRGIKIFLTKEIEETIKDYDLIFPQLRDKEVEWKISFPFFVETYLNLIKENGKIPSQHEFVIEYFERNTEEINKLIDRDGKKRALAARLRRTYPSLVRDTYFLSLLNENDIDAYYDMEKDVYEGIDMVVNYKGETFFVHCYVNTSYGTKARHKKNSRHDFEGKHIDIFLDQEGVLKKTVGNFYLYSENHVEILIEKMEDEIQD